MKRVYDVKYIMNSEIKTDVSLLENELDEITGNYVVIGCCDRLVTEDEYFELEKEYTIFVKEEYNSRWEEVKQYEQHENDPYDHMTQEEFDKHCKDYMEMMQY